MLEFIYAQSPESMKGLLTGLFYFFLGVASIPSAALYYLYKTSLENKTLLPFYIALTIITVRLFVNTKHLDWFQCVCVCVCRWWVQCSIWWLELCIETDREMMGTVFSGG